MRVFVSEYICSGALAGESLPDSFFREGRAMLRAIVADLMKLDAISVATTLDSRLSDVFPPGSSRLSVQSVSQPSEERIAFDQLASSSDATMVIAPETDDVLGSRVRRVSEIGGRLLNCDPDAIDLCGDKWRLYQHLQAAGIPTIPTQLIDLTSSVVMHNAKDHCVIKPRDGAGSWLTFLLTAGDRNQWNSVVASYQAAGMCHRALLQPYVEGLPLSASCICRSSDDIDVFPTGRQSLKPDSFQYQGGDIPAELTPDVTAGIETLVRQTAASIPGLRGYIGFDLILPHSSDSPLIVEINPRLTTSYIAYRRLCLENLAARILSTVGESTSVNESRQPLRWNLSRLRFRANGECEFE